MLVLEATQAPPRSLQQRRDALAKGNAIRIWRSQLKRRVHDRKELFHELIVSGDERLETMQVRHLLNHVPAFGPTRTTRMMRQVGISPTKTIGGLTDRQRDDLIAVVMAQVSYQRLLLSLD